MTSPRVTLALFCAAIFAAGAQSAPMSVVASAFGPGLYGNRTACGQTLTPRLLGVAHRSWPCGSRVNIRYGGRVVSVRVVDRGPFVQGRAIDLTAATAYALCGCSPRAWGVRRIVVTR
jgi:rare lipoprotein A